MVLQHRKILVFVFIFIISVYRLCGIETLEQNENNKRGGDKNNTVDFPHDSSPLISIVGYLS